MLLAVAEHLANAEYFYLIKYLILNLVNNSAKPYYEAGIDKATLLGLKISRRLKSDSRWRGDWSCCSSCDRH